MGAKGLLAKVEKAIKHLRMSPDRAMTIFIARDDADPRFWQMIVSVYGVQQPSEKGMTDEEVQQAVADLLQIAGSAEPSYEQTQ